MADLKFATGTGSEGVVGEMAVEEFKSGLRGAALQLGDDGYEETRKIWNGLIDKRPALIPPLHGGGGRHQRGKLCA